MSHFMVRFFISNLYLSAIIPGLILIKKLLRNHLSSRTQYHMGYLALALLAVPFLRLPFGQNTSFFTWLSRFPGVSAGMGDTLAPQGTLPVPASSVEWLTDFSLSVSRGTSPGATFFLLTLWLLGMAAMTALSIKSMAGLRRLERSSLPLSTPALQTLYAGCLKEMGIKKEIPLRITARLKSPVMAGHFHPCIYLPSHLVSDQNCDSLRHMLLHELQHYRHQDSAANHLMNLAATVYWFNPFVWYALREMRCDRELACDASVLQLLQRRDYAAYGNTLIDLAEKLSSPAFPLASGIGGGTDQIHKRILNIASYRPSTRGKRIWDRTVFCGIALVLSILSPALSAYGGNDSYYPWNPGSAAVSYPDLSSYFEGYSGCFALYDPAHDVWEIYNEKGATTRVSPNSTYKIYDALFGLEDGIITPQSSFMPWDGTVYPFEAWNAGQDLNSAMKNSVNWYFQSLDSQLDKAEVGRQIEAIQYGNRAISGGSSTYWMESTLQISPVEQVELLGRLYYHQLPFDKNAMETVKDSLRLTSFENGALYGKTGTGQVDHRQVNGWFVGYVEVSGQPSFFAVNILADENASGSKAAEIAMEILSHR